MEYLFLVLRWIHITSSIILVGGVFYYRFTVLPAIDALPPDHREAMSLAMRRSSAMMVRLAMLLLIVTGLVNMILVPKFYDFPVEGERGAYSMLVGLKFLLALPIFFVVDMMNGRSAMAERFREKSRMWLNVAVFLSIVIIVIGGYVRFIERTGKPDNVAVPAVDAEV